MTHAELRAAAQRVVARGDSGGGYVLTLVLPGEGTGATRRLAGRSGPRGDYRTEWVRCPCTEEHDTDTEENDDA